MFVQEPIQAAIWHCLNHYAYSDAIFLAERLFSEVHTEDSLFLLATAYFRGGRKLQCYDLLKNNEFSNSRCRYLMTLCCAEMEKFHEAEELLAVPSTATLNPQSITTKFGDSAPFAHQILGRICTATDRQEIAKEAYLASLKANPFLWESYCKLCSLGENVDPEEVFQLSHLTNFAMCHGAQNIVLTGQMGGAGEPHLPHNASTDKFSNSRHMSPIIKATPVGEEMGILHPSNKNRPPKYRNLFTSTPTNTGYGQTASTFGFLPIDSSPDSLHILHSTPTMLHSPFMGITSNLHELSEPRTKKQCLRVPPSWQQQQQAVLSPSTPAAQSPLNSTNVVRRSSRLFSNSNVSVKENNKTPPAISRLNASTKSPNRKNRLRTPKTTSQENQKNAAVLGGVGSEPDIPSCIMEADMDLSARSDFNFMNSHPMTDKSLYLSLQGTPKDMEVKSIQLQKSAAEGLMALLREMGKAYLHLSRFECNEAAEALLSSESKQKETGSFLSLMAKAFFEMGAYEEAIKYYQLMRRNEPYRFEGLEWLSTALWHLQREIELSALAHDLLIADKSQVSTWIAAGNCFSLQKEHETAITYFKRAIQADPRYAYSYTLLGHEYVATEELEKAMMAFRNASRLDPRHYNAWYGMGMIFYKQERFTRAEVYYRKALAIHPNNSVLLCHLGVVQHAESRTEKSLATFAKALKANPKNPLCKFHRASVLFAVNRLDEALDELEELKLIVPKESLVYFLMAKIYSRKGETHKALLHFSWATDLDPKGANNQIKESIEPILSRSINASNVSTAGPSAPTSASSAGGASAARPSSSSYYFGTQHEQEILDEISDGVNEVSL